MLGRFYNWLGDTASAYEHINAFKRKDGSIDMPMWALYLRSNDEERDRILRNMLLEPLPPSNL